MNTNEALAEVFKKAFKSDSIILNESMDSSDFDGWDSFKHIEILLACEEQFNIRFNALDIDKIKSIGDLIRVIELKINQ